MVTTPVPATLPDCEAHVRLRFLRPGPTPAHYPKEEDPRPLQLRVVNLRVFDRP